MKRLLSAVLLLALAPLASGQIETGYYTSSTGYTVKVEVSDSNGSAPGVDVTVTDAGGSATATGGTTASGSTQEKPKAKSFNETTTPRGSETVKGEGGKVKRKKADGTWEEMRFSRKKPKNAIDPSRPQPGLDVGGPGEEGTSNPGGPQSL